MGKLSDPELADVLADLSGWAREGDAIRKEFTFRGFRSAIAFIYRLAEKADEAKHHPDLFNSYNIVVVSLTTHDAGGGTERDVALARDIDSVAEPPEA